ncbi:15205_t:CDS:2, partial [Gigaspora rosea]
EKRLSRKEQKRIPAGIVVWFQTNGWMDTKLMIKFVDYLHKLRLKNGTRNKPTMLVYDSFKGHLDDWLKVSLVKWHNWMEKGGAGYSAKGNLRCARIKSFKTCKITNDSNESNSDLEVIDLSDTDNESNSDLKVIDL